MDAIDPRADPCGDGADGDGWWFECTDGGRDDSFATEPARPVTDDLRPVVLLLRVTVAGDLNG